MMKKISLLSMSTLFAAVLLVIGSASPLFGTDDPPVRATTYKVTVTNLTRGQPFSPVIITTHSAALAPIFEIGEPASDELYPIAEDAELGPMTAKLGLDPEVFDVQTLFGVNGPILPGETASVMINSDNGFPQISMAGMLVVTNDAFFGLAGSELPLFDKVKFYVPAYDAGSESNNENGRFIPGPPFGNGGKRETSQAEGFVHVHPGVEGKVSLMPKMHDWRNPVARVVIEAM